MKKAFANRKPEPGVKQSAGYTLIEVVLVMGIFAVGVLGTYSMQLAAKKTATRAWQTAMAVEFATDTMERLMRVGNGIDDDGDGLVDESDEGNEMWLANTTDLDPAGNPHRRGDNVVPIDTTGNYTWVDDLFWAVTDVDTNADGTNDAKRIVITVQWDQQREMVNLVGVRPEML